MTGFLNLLSILLVSAVAVSRSLEHCNNGLVCPDGNTCCSGGCIASDLGKSNATCCDDGHTGCGVSYVCREGGGDCVVRFDQAQFDPLVEVLPRYHLCHPKQSSLETVHGFPVVDPVHKLAYYSSHGNFLDADKIFDVDFVLVVIHGANRNADDYFCSASAAVALQSNYKNVLIVVPRFVTVSDGPLMLHEGGTALRWSDDGNGPWRFGARSVHPIPVSSFAAVDHLVEALLQRTSPSTNVVMAGHSSGGQFVQRWSLLTTVWSPNRMRTVVANPSSYAYLTPQRKIEGQWRLPATENDCTRYNQWEWGLDEQPGNASANDIDDEYKRHAMELIGQNTTELIQRFGSRDLVYMIGSLDRCNVSSAGGWCHSHGLETSCMDELQGNMRFERLLNYIESLEKIVGITTHRRMVVSGVGHDHSLMFTRPEGLSAIFGGFQAMNNKHGEEIQ
jgi:pimeloyl-ACP methyl ester carboxylesterase